LRTLNYKYFSSPLGDIEITFGNNFIYAFHFMKEGAARKEEIKDETKLIIEIERQLKNYFEGSLKEFDLPLKFEGTGFQNKVWTELTNIPFGKTLSYLQMAKNLGDEKCIRAAASANGKNPFAIVVPCHRVIGKDGSLTGYAGELWRKQWLLDHEEKVCGKFQKLF